MAVNTSGHAGGTSHSDDIAFFHSVANFYQIFGVMGIQCGETVAVVDFYVISEFVMIGGFYHSACSCCADGYNLASGGKVNAFMHTTVADGRMVVNVFSPD